MVGSWPPLSQYEVLIDVIGSAVGSVPLCIETSGNLVREPVKNYLADFVR